MSEVGEYQLVVSFEDQSHAYCHGFEAGQIYARMLYGENPIEPPFPLHTANVETFRRMAAARGYQMEAREVTFEDPEGMVSAEARADIVRTFTDVRFFRSERPKLRVVS